MCENAGTWDVLTTLESTSLTPILACLEGEERKSVLQIARKVQTSLAKQDYDSLLDALDASNATLVHETDLIEQSILAMLYDLKLENVRDRDFRDALGTNRERIEKIAGDIAKAKSLDILIDRALSNTHDQLVDYASRVRLGREIMTDNPQFWEWLGAYSGIDGLLRRDEERRLSKTNSFVKMLSVLFQGDRDKDRMSHVNSTCQGIMDKCKDDDILDYARKLSEAYDTTLTEMQLFVIMEKEFGDIQVEVRIPHSCKNSDLAIRVDGILYFVEAYTSRDFTFGHVSTYQADLKDEWARLLRKSQVKDLALANERTIFVLNVRNDYLSAMETCRPDFWAHVCAAMPKTSEVVIIRRRDIEVTSVRGGQIVETTGLGRRLASAIGDAWQ